MKILLFLAVGLVGLIGLAVITLLIMGTRVPKELRAEAQIDRPPADVFQWVTQPELRKQWMSWLVEVRPVSDTPNHVGSRSVLVMDDPNMQRKIEIASEVTAYEENRKLGVNLSVPEMFNGTAEYLLEPVGERGTKLTYVASFDHQHWIATLMKPLVAPQARDKARRDIDALKKLAEAR